MENNEQRQISAFDHEHTVWHLSQTNLRMLIALITVCITFIITILVFVHGYTVREKHWLDAITSVRQAVTSEYDETPGQQQEP